MTEQAERDQPATFAELNGSAAPKGRACRLCGELATHLVTLAVKEIRAGQGLNGPRNTVASHRNDYCERHAVQLFTSVRKAMK